MKKINVILISILFLFVSAVGNISFAEAEKSIIRGNNGEDKERVAKNYNWPQVLLEKEDVGFLPTSPFYFLKEWNRNIKKFFTFNPVKKAELELRYIDEKLIEAAKVVDENCGENATTKSIQCNEQALQKAFNNYFESQERLAKRLESLDEKNPSIEKLLSKLGERIILHQALFDELINNIPETEQREGTPKRKSRVIVTILSVTPLSRVSYEPKSIDQVINKLPYREGIRQLKALEILTRLEENLPEEAKKGIGTAKEAIQNKLIETGEIQKAKDWKIEQGSSGWIFVEGVPVETKAVEKVIEKIEEKAKEVSPVSQRPNIVNLEAARELKIKIQEAPSVRKVGYGGGDYLPASANFKVEIDGVIVAEFKEVSGIESETEVIEHQDGDDIILRKRPGRVKYNNIVLKRGFIYDPKLREWYEKVAKGVTERKSISIIVLDRAGKKVRQYNLMDAFPVKFEGGDYSIEEIEFKVEGGVTIGKKLKLTPDKVESVSERIRIPVACPLIAPDISKGKEECLKASKHLDEIYPGCNYAKACGEISEQKPSLDCGSAPASPGTWRCIDGVWKDISQCGKIQCLRYDPVCGTDGKTYSCGEVDAEACGVKVAYKGECKKEEYPTPPLPNEQPTTSSKSVPTRKLP